MTRTHALAATLLLALATVSQAQATGTLVVTFAGSAAADATVRIHVAVTTPDAAARVVRTDSLLERAPLVLAAVPVGRYRVETRAIGFVPDTTFVDIGEARRVDIKVDLRRVTALDPVTVQGTSKGHLAAFEKRRTAGKGTFLTREEIEKSHRGAVTEVLRSVRGLRVDCGNGCKVKMVRSTSCEPRYFINGFPGDASVLNTPLLDVAGIEIYRGPSETPGEFLGAQSMCGALVIWTK